jgi:hypothetical protein
MKRIYLYLFIIIIVAGCASVPDRRTEQQQQFYETQQKAHASIQQSINKFNENSKLYEKYQAIYSKKENNFLNNLTPRQNTAYTDYLRLNSYEDKMTLTATLSVEQMTIFHDLDYERKNLEEWSDALIKWRQNLTDQQQQLAINEQRWNTLNQQIDEEARQDAAAWQQVSDSLQRLSDTLRQATPLPTIP